VTWPPPAMFNNSGPSSIATLQNRWRMGKDRDLRIGLGGTYEKIERVPTDEADFGRTF
jgi:hypothetical protein